MRLLLVEDSSRLRRSLALGLRKAGYTVDDSGDGHEGQWKAETGKYDLIILDIMLPTVNGFERFWRKDTARSESEHFRYWPGAH
jgi:DNA-binding response OmpR family regulator